MKKLVIFIALMLIPFTVFAADESISTYEKSSSEVLFTSSVAITAVTINTDGSNDVTLSLYDMATAVESYKLFSQTVIGSDSLGGRNYTFPLRTRTGLYAKIAGTNGKYTIEVKK